MSEKISVTGFITFKQLCDAYNTTRQTLKKEIEKVPGLKIRPFKRYYTPAEQKKIFNHLGNPFE